MSWAKFQSLVWEIISVSEKIKSVRLQKSEFRNGKIPEFRKTIEKFIWTRVESVTNLLAELRHIFVRQRDDEGELN